VTAWSFKNDFTNMVSTVPLMRVGNPEDVAGTALFLSSRAGAYVNGTLMIPTSLSVSYLSGPWFTAATITLDGGLTSSYPRSRM
jgi:NAD(P)-dependent dehydrogenase (short-subunit alcohol dehydrogenase family)